MPWVHLDDVVRLLAFACRTPGLAGPLNVVAGSATNADFTRALGRAVHRPAFLPVPRTALRVAFGEISEVLVASKRVVPDVASRAGFTFRYPELAGALAETVRERMPEAA